MTDTELVDWLCAHPIVSTWAGVGEEAVTLTSFASVGHGRDWRAAALALVANSQSRGTGIPNARDRKVAAGLPVPDDDSYVEAGYPGLREDGRWTREP